MGAFVNATISAADIENVFTVPRTALRRNNTLYVLDDNNQLQIQPVEIFHSDKNHIYIQHGLQDGQRLILTNIQTPVAGMALRVEDDDASVAVASDAQMPAKTSTDAVTAGSHYE